MIPRSRLKYWTILPTLTLALTLYLTLITITITQQNFQNNFKIISNNSVSGGGNVKEIVAYSLMKQIEIDSKEVECNKIQLNNNKINESSLSLIKGIRNEESVGLNNLTNEREDERGDLWTKVDGTDLFVYSVYSDYRLDPYHYLRIIGMVGGSCNETVYCQILTEDGTYHTTKVTITSIWSDKWNQEEDRNVYYNPVLLSCKVPVGTVPVRVSLSRIPCELNVQNSFKIKKDVEGGSRDFTVCVKPLNFEGDISKRLIQWIEMIRILGADRIEFYVKKIKRSTRRILKWYASTLPNQIVIKGFSNIPENTKSKEPLHRKFSPKKNISPNYLKYIWQKRRYELITYNDCFYRNLHSSNFVIPLDIDEIIVPRRHKSWQHLLNSTIPTQEFASHTVQNAYYLREFNHKKKKDTAFFLRDITRSELSERGESGKSFISTRNALTVFNHYALDVLQPGIRKVNFLSPDLVQMNHYKKTCSVVILPECVKYMASPVRIADPVIFRFKKDFLRTYAATVNRLQHDDLL